MARITIEDCLKKTKNRFALVLLASKRTKQLLKGSNPLINIHGNKEIVIALREIAAGKIKFSYTEYSIKKNNLEDYSEFIEEREEINKKNEI